MRTIRATLLFLLCTTPVLVGAQNYGWLTTVIDEVRYAVGITVPALLGVAVLFFVWGLIGYLWNSDKDDAREEGRRHMTWGIVALFVIVTVWGLVALLNELTGVTTGQQYDAPGVDNAAWNGF